MKPIGTFPQLWEDTLYSHNYLIVSVPDTSFQYTYWKRCMQWMNGLGMRLRIPISTEHVMNVEDDTCDDVQPRSNS